LGTVVAHKETLTFLGMRESTVLKRLDQVVNFEKVLLQILLLLQVSQNSGSVPGKVSSFAIANVW
jgi:hypothetical protein